MSPYIANTKQDWSVVCVDEYFETVYKITLIIKSVPYLVPGVDTFGGWN